MDELIEYLRGVAENANLPQYMRDRLTEAAAALEAAREDAWVSVTERLPPDGEVVEVYGPDVGDGPLFDFDGVEDGRWVEHDNRREHFLMVGGSAAAGPDVSCTGPAEDAPYTHWRPLRAPAIDQARGKAGQEVGNV